MKLSKKEYRYRMKIIQENNYNKAEQKILDEATMEIPSRYEDIYEAQRGGVVYCFMAIIESIRVAKAFASVGKSFDEITEGLEKFERAVKETCGAEGNQMLEVGAGEE